MLLIVILCILYFLFIFISLSYVKKLNALVTLILGAEAIIFGSIICFLLFGLNIVRIDLILRCYLSSAIHRLPLTPK